MALQVPVSPALFAAARERGLKRTYQVWCALRAVTGERGWIEVAEVRRALHEQFGIADSTVRQWLKLDAEQQFWAIAKLKHGGTRVIFIRGLARVHAALGCPPMTRLAYVTPENFRGVRRRNRSNLLGHIAVRQPASIGTTPVPTRPMARHTIQKHTSISPASQKRYARMGEITSYPNVLIRDEAPTPTEAHLKHMVRIGPTWFEPLSNSYSVAPHAVIIGGKATKKKLIMPGQVAEPLPASAARRYYHRVRAYLRHQGDGERFLREGEHGGTVFWRSSPTP